MGTTTSTSSPPQTASIQSYLKISDTAIYKCTNTLTVPKKSPQQETSHRPSQYCPGGQLRQSVKSSLPFAGLYDPFGHGYWYGSVVPRGQQQPGRQAVAVQSVAFSWQQNPAGQLVHTACMGLSLKQVQKEESVSIRHFMTLSASKVRQVLPPV